MERRFKSTITILFAITFMISTMAIMQPAAFAEDEAAITTDFYVYTPNDEGGYTVSLNSRFKDVLDSTSETSYTGDIPSGGSLTWNNGDPLPNPAPNGEYNGKNVTDMNGMFRYCGNIITLDLSNFDTRNVINMSQMFQYCFGLINLDISNFDTSNVTDMSSMFQACKNIITLDLSNFDTRNVINMSKMFDYCIRFTNLDISNFDTSNVTDMSSMFYSCSGLTNIDLSSFNTQNVTDMSHMFFYCSGLTNLDLSNFDTQNVTDMSGIFWACSGLTTLDLSSFDTQSATDMSEMFNDCNGLTKLDLSNFDTQNATDISGMFYSCRGLTNLNLSSFNTQNATNMNGMFNGCRGLTNLDVSNFDTGNVTDMGTMFYLCSGLTNLNLSSFDTQNVTDMSGMFGGCDELKNLDVNNFNTGNVRDMHTMFYSCSGLTNLDLSSFDTQTVIDMSSMFRRCGELKNLDVNNFDTGNVTDMSDMFRECSELKNLDVNNFNTGNVRDMHTMFYSCSGLTNLDLSSFDTQKVTDMQKMFYSCSGLTNLDLSSFDTQNVTDMDAMFHYCSGLTNLDLSSFDTQNVTDMSQMFYGCEVLTTLDLSSFDTSKVTNMQWMFKGCSGLMNLDLSNFDIIEGARIENMFIDCSSLVSEDVKPALLIVKSSEVKTMLNDPLKNTGIVNSDLETLIASTLTINDNLDKIYDGNPVSEPMDFSQTGSTQAPSFSWYKKSTSEVWELINVAPINCGEYKVVGTVEVDGEYYSGTGEKEFEITKANNSWTIEPSIEDWSYGDKANTPIAEATYNNDNLVITYSTEKDGNYKSEVPSEAGVYYAKFYVKGTENYNKLQKIIKFEITKFDNNWTIEPSIEDWRYGDKANKPTAEATYNNDNLVITYSTEKDGTYKSEVPSKAGVYYAKFYVPGTEKYNELQKIIEFEITKADNSWTIEPSIEDWSCGDKANTPEAEAAYNNENLVITYSTEKDGTYKSEVPSEAGVYYAKVYVPETSNCNELQKVIKFEITEKANFPKTDDMSNLSLWLLLSTMSVGIIETAKRKNKAEVK